MAVTKIGCFAPFGIGNISGSFWIQNHLNICIYVVHAISNIFVLVLGERKNTTNIEAVKSNWQLDFQSQQKKQ